MPVVAAVLIEPEGDPKKVLRVTLPLGMSIQPGTRVIVDNGQPMTGPYVICFNNGCMADYEASAELIGKLKKGQGLVVQGINGAGQPISLVVPLGDFAKAYDGPPTDPKEFEKQQKKLQEDSRSAPRKRSGSSSSNRRRPPGNVAFENRQRKRGVPWVRLFCFGDFACHPVDAARRDEHEPFNERSKRIPSRGSPPRRYNGGADRGRCNRRRAVGVGATAARAEDAAQDPSERASRSGRTAATTRRRAAAAHLFALDQVLPEGTGGNAKQVCFTGKDGASNRACRWSRPC